MTRETFSTSSPDREPIIKARSFNEIRATQKAARLPTQVEIDNMVRKAIAKAGPLASISKALPVLRTLDPVESMIAKAAEGTANPSDLDALIDDYVKKSMTPKDRGSVQRAYSRLADASDKGLSRLYTARQTAASTFNKNAAGRVSNRVAAEKQVAEVDAEIKRKAADLRRQFPGRFSEAQAISEVLDDEKELYSRYQEAKMACKPGA